MFEGQKETWRSKCDPQLWGVFPIGMGWQRSNDLRGNCRAKRSSERDIGARIMYSYSFIP